MRSDRQLIRVTGRIRRFRDRVVLAGLALCVPCAAVLAKPPDGERDSNLAHLAELENRVAQGVSNEGGERKAFGSYLIDSNPRLFDRLRKVVAAGGRSMTVVTGPAGLGKSGLLKELATSAKTDVTIVSLKEIADKLPNAVAPLPDLTSDDGKIVFNTLPRANNGTDLSLPVLCRQIAGKEPGPLVLIDDVDEVHPDTARLVLANVQKFVMAARDGDSPCHVFCFGRTEGFIGFYNDPTNFRAKEVAEIQLNGVTSYNDPMYLQVAAADLYRGREGGPEAGAKVVSFLRRHPALTQTMSLRSNANFMVEAINLSPSADADSVRAYVFDAMLRRNKTPHNRPSTDGELFRMYVRAFEDLAATYSKVDDEGFFKPRIDLPVALTNDGGTTVGTVSPRRLLDRSGLVVLDPPTFSEPRYRFEPIWLHSYLVGRQSARPTPVTITTKPVSAEPFPLNVALGFGFGVACIVILLVVAVVDPDPKPLALHIYRVVLALAAAGVSGAFSGLFEMKGQVVFDIRAAGPFAVFLAVYAINPPRLIADRVGHVRNVGPPVLPPLTHTPPPADQAADKPAPVPVPPARITDPPTTEP